MSELLHQRPALLLRRDMMQHGEKRNHMPIPGRQILIPIRPIDIHQLKFYVYILVVDEFRCLFLCVIQKLLAEIAAIKLKLRLCVKQARANVPFPQPISSQFTPSEVLSSNRATPGWTCERVAEKESANF
jgi:hypothetical protein